MNRKIAMNLPLSIVISFLSMFLEYFINWLYCLERLHSIFLFCVLEVRCERYYEPILQRFIKRIYLNVDNINKIYLLKVCGDGLFGCCMDL